MKHQVIQAIQQLPDDVDYSDISEELAFLAAVREAERDIAEGRLLTNAQMRARVAEWTGNLSDGKSWRVQPSSADARKRSI